MVDVVLGVVVEEVADVAVVGGEGGTAAPTPLPDRPTLSAQHAHHLTDLSHTRGAGPDIISDIHCLKSYAFISSHTHQAPVHTMAAGLIMA